MHPDGTITLNWHGRGDVGGVFRYYSFAAVMQSALAKELGDASPVLPDGVFKDKIVIIGDKTSGSVDLKSSPYTWGVPGMEIWATYLSNLNNADYVHHAKPWVNYLITLLITFLTLLIVTRLTSGHSASLLIILIVLVMVFGLVIFSVARYAVQIVIPFIAFIVTWLFIMTVSYVMEGKTKREMRQLFNRYVNTELVQRIVDHPELIQMDGDEYHATVMLAISTALPPSPKSKNPETSSDI